MMTLAAITLYAQFTFKGGTVCQLVQALSDSLKRPIAVLCSKGQPPLAAFTISYLDEPHLILRLGHKLDYEVEGRKQYAYAPTGWPDEYVGRKHLQGFYNPASKPSPGWPRETRPDGTISITAADRPFAIENDMQGPWPKPIKVAPFFQGMLVAVAAKDVRPEEAFRTLAAAVGARAIFTEKEWTLAFDGKEFRRRLIPLLKKVIADATAMKDPLGAADGELCLTTLDALSDDQLEATAANPNGSIELNVQPGTEIAQAAAYRLKAYANAPLQINGRLSSGAEIVNKLDLERPIQIVVRILEGRTFIQGKVKGNPTMGITF